MIFCDQLEAELLSIAGRAPGGGGDRPEAPAPTCPRRARGRAAGDPHAGLSPARAAQLLRHKEGNLARVIVVTSGKGGVGKTTTTAAIATGLALQGKKTVVIDFDVGLRNLDLIMGCERRVVFDFVNVINDGIRCNQALIKDKRVENLYVLPTSQTRDKDALDQRRRREGAGRAASSSSTTSSATARPASRRARRWRCTSPTRRWSSPTPKSPRCATATASSACSTARRAAPRSGEEPVKQHLLLTRYDPDAGREGRDAEGRGRAGDPGDPAARRDPAGRRGAAGLQRRHAGDPGRDAPRPARPTPTRSSGWPASRSRCGSRHPPRRASSSGCCGGPRETVRVLRAEPPSALGGHGQAAPPAGDRPRQGRRAASSSCRSCSASSWR